MKELLQSRLGKVLIIDPSGAVRLEIQSALRLVGYREFEMVNNITEAKKFLRIGAVDWIVTQVFSKETENVCHLLKFIYDGPVAFQRRPVVSMLLNSEETDMVPKAFELGLLSCHRRHIVRDFLISEFEQLLTVARECKYESEFIAATYLRRYLSEKKLFDHWSHLEHGLLSFRPAEAKTLLRIAEVNFQRRNFKDGIAYLSQALVADPSLMTDVERIKRAYSSPTLDEEFKKLTATFDINRCMIVDPDEAVHLAIIPILKQLNISQVDAFVDGEQAWKQVVEKGEPDLLICEWKIPKISGPAFIQRMRAQGLHKAPVMLLSSLIRESDAMLVSELGIAKIAAKPVDVKQFVVAVSQTLQQDRKPTESLAIERKILKHANLNQTSTARALLETYREDPGVALGRKHYMTAEVLYAEGKYETAKDEAIKALKLTERDSLATTNLLGKCLMKMGDFQAALQFMQKAQSISPSNIDRLCSIAELQIATNDFDLALKTIHRAKKIDAGNQQIAATQINLALMTNQKAEAEKMLPQLSSPTQVISFMNTQAVSRIRSQQFSEGIELYKRTIDLLNGSSYSDVKARLHYNLGLAYVRQNVYEEALQELTVAEELGGQAVKFKAKSLILRIQDAMKNGVQVKLNLNAGSGRDDDSDLEFFSQARPTIAAQVLKEVERARPGDMCLRGIFRISNVT